jgi:hypothetical protein
MFIFAGLLIKPMQIVKLNDANRFIIASKDLLLTSGRLLIMHPLFFLKLTLSQIHLLIHLLHYLVEIGTNNNGKDNVHVTVLYSHSPVYDPTKFELP